MKRICILSLFILIILMGCSNDDAYNNAVETGLEYIENEEYEKAESVFELALDEKAGDDKATALLEQTRLYQELLVALENNEQDVINDKLNNIVNIEGGSSTLVTQAKKTIESNEEVGKNENLSESKPEQVEDEETDQTQDSNNAKYEKYDNGPFGFSIEYPTSFSPGPMQGDNDGIRFRGEEEMAGADIYVSGSHHESVDNGVFYPEDSDSMKILFDYEISKLEENDNPINYQKLDEENNWFVISYKGADKIIYQKKLAADHSFAEMIIAYPKDSQDKYKSIVEKVAGSFTIKNEK